jgi:hypothetical protein
VRLRLGTLPLAVGTATSAGATTALLLGAYIPSWGVAGGAALGLATLALGLRVVPGHRELLVTTLALAGFVLGFLVATIPATLVGLDDFVASKLPELRALAGEATRDVRSRLFVRWSAAGVGVLLAGVALLIDRRRATR